MKREILLVLLAAAMMFGNVAYFYGSVMDNISTNQFVDQRPVERQRTRARRCNITQNSMYRSQRGEDKFLLERFFNNVCGGTYIEMGALDGITYSNSFYFNGALDWKGVLIEANPNNYKKLVLNRQFELVTPIHAAVCDKEKDVHWVSRNAGNGATGGIFEFAPKEFQEKWWSKN
jgi:hypothetical protein